MNLLILLLSIEMTNFSFFDCMFACFVRAETGAYCVLQFFLRADTHLLMWKYFNCIKSYQIHDLMHERITQRPQKEYF